MTLKISKLVKPLRTFELEVTDLELHKGEIVGLVGANGSGKSTLIKLLTRELETADAQITLDGDYNYLDKLGYIPDSLRFENLSIVSFMNYYDSVYSHFDSDKFFQSLSRYDLDRNSNISELSLGESQKLMFSIINAMTPTLFIFDEPSDGYDSESLNILKSDLLNLATDDNLFIISTHQIKFYENILDRILYIQDGKIVHNLTSLEVQANGHSILLNSKSLLEDVERFSNQPSLENFIIAVERGGKR